MVNSSFAAVADTVSRFTIWWVHVSLADGRYKELALQAHFLPTELLFIFAHVKLVP